VSQFVSAFSMKLLEHWQRDAEGARCKALRSRSPQPAIDPTCNVPSKVWGLGRLKRAERAVPEETAVAFTYGGTAYAVMMATPQDLKDFALGFSMTERILASAADFESVDVIEERLGIELRIKLAGPRKRALLARRRYLAGPVGCGLCGIESLEEAMRSVPRISDETEFSAGQILEAVGLVEPSQTIHRKTRAVHAAGFYAPGRGIAALREDVGRHNALDKLAGALANAKISVRGGFGIVTSRLSIEMIQKAAVIGFPMIVALSAPTALAVRAAKAAGMTLVGVARPNGFEIFTHAWRIKENPATPTPENRSGYVI
jgi:FdhD protein